MEDFDFAGADADALSMLGAVSGQDFVGAGIMSPNLLAAHRAAPALHTQAALAAAGSRAIQFARKVNQDRKLRHAALAGYIPQTMIPVSTAAGVTIAASGALTLQGSAGVPCRITKYVVEPAIASFFGIAAITAARLNMVAGGTGLVPATRFLPTAYQTPIENPVLGAGAPVFVTGANLDAGAAHPYLSSFDAVDLTPAAARLT